MSLYPSRLAGVQRGVPMNFQDAGGLRCNPSYDRSKFNGARYNCQSCVVAYEARLRGYNVRACSAEKFNYAQYKLRQAPNLAWIDIKTGRRARYTYSNRGFDADSYLTYLRRVIKPGRRYTMQFRWKHIDMGHLVNIEKTEDGRLRIFDAQTSEIYGETQTDSQEILSFLNRFAYVYNGQNYPPRLLRVDDKAFNLRVVNQILESADEKA